MGYTCIKPVGLSQWFKKQMWIHHKAVKTIALNTTVTSVPFYEDFSIYLRNFEAFWFTYIL